jgi:hypothetical protein
VLNTKTHKWVGFVDMVDLVHHALNVLNIPKSDLDTADFDQLLVSSDKFANEPCGSIVGTGDSVPLTLRTL